MITVIVPVYKVEDYLSRCIDSILAQSYRDFELLLIDDGSPDCCGKICDDYANRDTRIRVFHKENGGLSDARNYGLDRKKGEYVTFIDSDDYIGPDYLKILMDMLTEHNADVSLVSYIQSSAEQIDWKPFHADADCAVMDGKECFCKILERGGISVSAWGKLFKESMFQEARFPYGKKYEDLFIIPYLLEASSVVVYSSSAQYCYFQRDSSIMNSPPVSGAQTMDYLDGQERLLEFTKDHYPQYMPMAQRRFISGIFSSCIDWLVYKSSYRQEARRIKTRFRYYFRGAWLLPDLTRTERIKASLFHCNVSLYRFFRLFGLRLAKKSKSYTKNS